MTIKLKLLIFSLLLAGNVLASDTEFWFVAPQLDNQAVLQEIYDRPVYFSISAGNLAATVTMEMPALSGFKNRVINLATGESKLITFAPDQTSFSNAQIDTISDDIRTEGIVGVKYNRGIHFTSTAPVSIYYQVDNYYSKDLFVLKGEKALGTEFYTPFQTVYQTRPSWNPNSYPQFHIVATEDNTTVQITPAANIVGTNAGVTKTVVLNRGETFAARTAAFAQAARLAGSHIVSNKPIAVTMADDCVQASGTDVIGDQLIPVNNLGTSYVVVRGFLNATYGDYVFVLATQNGTEVKVDGTTVATLSAGEQYYYKMATTMTSVIVASKPVYVLQLSGYGSELGAALLPSLYSINTRSATFYKPPSTFNHNIFAMVRSGNEDGFTVNGNTTVLMASDFSTVSNMTDWKYARKDISLVGNGTVTVNNSKGTFALGYFFTGAAGGTSASFGYLSDYGILQFPDTMYLCSNDTINLYGGYAKSYDWTLPDGSHSSDSIIKVTKPGKYTVTVNQDPFLVTTSTLVLQTPKLPLNLSVSGFMTIQVKSDIPAAFLSEVTAKGFEYRKIGDATWTPLAAGNSFVAAIDLKNGKYEFRAWADVGCGRIYSDVKTIHIQCDICN